MSPAFTRVKSYTFCPDTWAWSIPSGTTCPGAEQCLAKADRHTGVLTNGPKQKFRCYSAVGERYASVRARYWCNFEAVRKLDAQGVQQVLQQALPRSCRMVRIHTAGDFFNEEYFLGWMRFAAANPIVWFWAFTKSIPVWVKNMHEVPNNVELQASYGGRYDAMIEQHGLKSARVVESVAEAERLGLAIDTNDKLAAYAGSSFALLDKSVSV